MAFKKCAYCGSRILFGSFSKDGYDYCNQICMEWHHFQGFCGDCVAETTDESPGGTSMINGVGTKLFSNSAKCPACFSVIKRKFFAVVFIPVIPLKTYRIRPMPRNRYIGRLLPSEKRQTAAARVTDGVAS